MKYQQLISLFAILLFCDNIATSQEVVTGLQSNREISAYSGKISSLKSKGVADTLELPFFDDFSYSNVLPDDSLWSDSFVFINNTYPIDQLSLGVATFDALNDQGLLYEIASATQFEADRLTSRPINLEGDATDNFYLSFFYQPQGIADPPEKGDSLTLQFYSASDDEWFSVWRSEGSAIHAFKPVILPIDDPRFTEKGFRFRFINYATLSTATSDLAMIGNADQWHIDYVELDRGRDPSDTLLHDVAFTLPLRSLLADYETMPWNQFKEWTLSAMGSFVKMNYLNNDNIIRNVSRSFYIRDVYNDILVLPPEPLAKNVDPGTRELYKPALIYTFGSTSQDSALFEITATLITDLFDNKVNDTIRYLQAFSNYFSVDDGSSEGGYGINGQGSDNAIAVYRYRSLSPDTIRAIDICFNDSYLNANQRNFDLVVLSADNQQPGTIIYAQEELMVDPGETINGFTRYILDEPVYVDDFFFVGWRQRSETFLNAGLDFNTPPAGRQYYYLNGSWNISQINGSIMVRPVVGSKLVSTGNDDILQTDNRLRIWPNPASNIINLSDDSILDSSNTTITIYSTDGKLVRSIPFSPVVDISTLNNGIYIIVIYKNGTLYSTNKFIRTR